jgi:hypothetical protein
MRLPQTTSGGFEMFPLANRAPLAVVVVVLTGCSQGASGVHSRFEATPAALIGRWSALPKEVADEHPGKPDAQGALGESISFRWEFKDNQTFEMVSEVKGGLAPMLANKANVTGAWKVLEARGNTLTIELSHEGFAATASVAFETADRCLYSSGGETDEVLVLSRLP